MQVRTTLQSVLVLLPLVQSRESSRLFKIPSRIGHERQPPPTAFTKSQLCDKYPVPSGNARGGSTTTATPSPAKSPRRGNRGGNLLWKTPLLAAVISFGTFRPTSRLLHRFVQAASQRQWLPSTDEQINLQTNVVTQVVNGPVITSISVLFASLVSITITNLHERQVTIHQSLVWEVHQQRLLQATLQAAADKACLSLVQLEQAQSLLQQHQAALLAEQNSTERHPHNDPHTYLESSLMALYQLCNYVRARQRGTEPQLLADMQSLVRSMMKERGERWMALSAAAPFPAAHYRTLELLAAGIAVSFLVATAQAEVLFAEAGLYSVRVLWTVLVTAFASLAVVCYDLSKPFGGAYHVAGDARR